MSFNSEKKSIAKEYCKGGLIFKTQDDYISIWNDWLHFLYKPNPIHGENCLKPSLIQNFGFRKDESLFYKNLRDVSKLIDLIEPDCFKWDDELAFVVLFPFITEFLYEAEDFKHNNEKIERKFKINLRYFRIKYGIKVFVT